MNDQDRYEYIADYLNDLLSEEEQNAFLKKVKADALFRHEFQLHKDLHQQLAKSEELNSMEAVVADVIAKSKSTKKAKWIVLIIIFILGLIATSVFFYKHLQQPSKGKDIYIAYYEKYPPYPILRNTEKPTVLTQGLRSYAEGDYTKAIQKLTPLHTTDTITTATFYLAMSYMETAQYDKAEELLNDLGNSSNPEFNDAIRWYSALLLLRKEETDSAKVILNKLRPLNNKYGTLSKKLLDEE